MAWIESHQSLSRHRKTIRAAKLLGCDRHKLIGHLHELWWWALDNAGPDGELDGIGPEELAEAAGWKRPGFADALIEAGFIDRSEDGALTLHDWHDYAGKLNDRRAQTRASNAERQRRRRDRIKDGHATVTRDERDQTVTVTTLPNQPNQPYLTNPTDETNVSSPALAPADGDSGFRRASDALERLGARLNAIARDDIAALVAEGFRPEWFERACLTAASNDVKSWAYVRKVLVSWGLEGPPEEPRRNGHAGNRADSQPGKSQAERVAELARQRNG